MNNIFWYVEQDAWTVLLFWAERGQFKTAVDEYLIDSAATSWVNT